MRYFILTLLILTFYSCTSEDNDNQENSDSNFYALTVGNSWQYKWYGINNEGIINPSDIEESISIIGTEEINGNIYYKFSRVISGNFSGNLGHVPDNGEHIEYYRDSIGYLINEEGLIKFSNNYNDTFIMYSHDDMNGLVVNGIAETQSENTIYTTEAGSFDCLELIVSYEREDGFVYPAKNRVYYFEGIGLIKDDNVFLVSDTAGYYRMLESYNVQ